MISRRKRWEHTRYCDCVPSQYSDPATRPDATEYILLNWWLEVFRDQWGSVHTWGWGWWVWWCGGTDGTQTGDPWEQMSRSPLGTLSSDSDVDVDADVDIMTVNVDADMMGVNVDADTVVEAENIFGCASIRDWGDRTTRQWPKKKP